MTYDDDLSPQERQLLDSLPRELDPPDRVRERVREELLRRGVLRPTSRGGWARTGPRLFRWVAAAAILACVFLAGIIAGSRWSEPPVHTEVAASTVPGRKIVDGVRVQAAGSEYAAVIQALAEDPEVSREDLTAALATLRAAAGQMSEAPGLDPETVSLLRRLREQDLYPEEMTGLL